MGDPRKQHKKYKRPKRPYERERIEEEEKIKGEYGLKNKREIWKAKEEIARIRRQAKELITAQGEKKERFTNRLVGLGLIKKEATIDEVLELTEKNWLERRLQTIIFKKKLANSIRQARQLITHKKIKVNGKTVNVPSYIIKIKEENKIESVMPIKNIKKLSKEEKKLLKSIKNSSEEEKEKLELEEENGEKERE